MPLKNAWLLVSLMAHSYVFTSIPVAYVKVSSRISAGKENVALEISKHAFVLVFLFLQHTKR
jgi:hypothetical protein